MPLAFPPPSLAAEPVAYCVTCGAPLATPYCAECGERRASDRDYSLRHFATESIETITDADSTLWRSVKTLFARPGELTRAYMRGQRLGYTRPLQLFFYANVFYFFAAVSLGSRVFDTPLRIHMNQTYHSAIATRLVEAKLAKRGMTLQAYERTFDQAATVQAKTLIIAMVPVWAIGLAIVQLRKRRYAVEHLVFALHFFAAILVLGIVIHVLVGKPLAALLAGPDGAVNWGSWDGIVTLVTVIVQVTYLTLAFRRNYGDSTVVAVAKGLAMVVVFMYTLFAYRALLFFTVYSST